MGCVLHYVRTGYNPFGDTGYRRQTAIEDDKPMLNKVENGKQVELSIKDIPNKEHPSVKDTFLYGS